MISRRRTGGCDTLTKTGWRLFAPQRLAGFRATRALEVGNKYPRQNQQVVGSKNGGPVRRKAHSAAGMGVSP